MITNLKLKNWRSHEETEINFSDGTNVFIGSMGSGKTSIMNAICFGLFGTFPDLQAKKIKLEDMIMKKPKEQKAAEVIVSFTAGADTYSVKRNISKTKATSAELRMNDKLIESPQSQKVTEEVQKILKIDYDLFTRAIYSEQNQLDMFLTIPKGLRMKKIDEILAIDRFERARSTIVALLNKLKYSLSEKQKILLPLESDENIKNIEAARKDMERLRTEKMKFAAELERIRKECYETEHSLSELKEKEKKCRDMIERGRTLVELMKSIQIDIDQLKKDLMESVEKNDEELKDKMKEMEENFLRLKVALDDERKKAEILKQMTTIKSTQLKAIKEEKIPKQNRLVAEKREIENTLKKKDADSLKKKLEQLLAESDSEKEKLQKYLAKVSEMEESLIEIKGVGASCPICEQALPEDKKRRIIQKKETKIEDMRKEAKLIEKNIIKADEKRKNMEKEIREVEIFNIRLTAMGDVEKELKLFKDSQKQLEFDIGNCENELKMLDKAARILEKDVDEKRNDMEEMRKLISKRSELEKKFNRKKEMESELIQIQKDKINYSFFEEETISKLEKNLRELLAGEREIGARSEGMNLTVFEKETKLKEAEEKLSLLQKHKTETRKTEAIMEQMDMLENCLLSTQDQLRKNFISAVNQSMDEIWQSLYPYKDFFSVRLFVDEGDYVLQLQDSTGWVNADGFVSGGERAMACLALRIAFALVLAPQLRWLVLDEPTHNLDRKAVEDLSTTLRENISEFVDQVFLITHDPSLESAVSGFLYRLEREKERDEPTRIICVNKPGEL